QHLHNDLQRVETQLREGPFFNGEDFSLVDAAYAPPLMRFDLVEKYHSFKFLENFPKLQAWSKQLLNRVSVKNSVVPEFESLYVNAIKKAGGYPAQFFT
ncbi:glutathione S-transferase C-terminal domain-containing protein, partial [Kaarinaea lacus]